MAYIKTVWENGDVITKEKLNNIEDGIANAGGGGSPMKSTTHAELLAMRNAGTLTPGMQYRITDYVCTTTQEESRAVSHPFDIIVVADDASTLNENARACLHEGDTYYTAENHSANLEAWELKYCIDNDGDRFAWADATNGKGVIFWMKDERGNECPYDFKQIQFKRYKITECTVQSLVGMLTALEHGKAITAVDEANPVWVYTFSVYDPEAETPTYEDGSVAVMNEAMGCIVYGNVIKCYLNYADMTEYTGPYVNYLNNIVFDNTFGKLCYNNAFENGCNSNTFSNSFTNNTFGGECSRNTFGKNCNRNTFGNYFSGNTFGSNFISNTFGHTCSGNTFSDSCSMNSLRNGCGSNTFGKGCTNNTFGGYCTDNTFGENCANNTFGENCANNTFGDRCYSNTFGEYCGGNTFGEYCRGNTFGEYCIFINIPAGTNASPKWFYHILSGTRGTSSAPLTIPGEGGNNYVTYVGLDSSGELKTWVPADLVTSP